MIGIICAMKIEADAIRASLSDKVTETVSGVEFTQGTLHGKEIVIAVCGIGKVFAAICTEAMILRYSPELIINSGVAGTLTDALSIGDIAIAKTLVQHDMDTSPLGDPVGLISGINKIHFEADTKAVKAFEDAVKEVGANSVVGTIASGDQFMSDTEKKNIIRDRFNAIACEMEGAAIAHVAYVNSVPFAVLRAISDSASGDAQMEYPKFVAMASERSHRIIDTFVKLWK
ncbi:MAG: 5'-methylthioadenosine/adenosylhomocysteine nucleosidase [Clostridia bacterium]|nr:5'-methylthioadenosine/adenosylhomocysteine nucleosidase [Clostridia bacterium]